MPMIPRIPKSKFEDQTTPRICFSTSIQGCLIGVNENKDISGEVFHVYGLDTPDYITPTKEQVKDVDITGEVWVTKKCSPKHLYDIKVIGKKSERTEKINGKTFKVPVWDYEKVEILKESEVLDESEYYLNTLLNEAIEKNSLQPTDRILKLDKAFTKMFTPYSYGFLKKEKPVKYSDYDNDSDFWNDFFEYNTFKSVQDSKKYKHVVCTEVVEIIADYFSKYDIPYKKWLMVSTSGEPHCVITAEIDGFVVKFDFTPQGRENWKPFRTKVFASEDDFIRPRYEKGKKTYCYNGYDPTNRKPSDLVKDISKRFNPICLKESVSHENSLNKQDILKLLSTLDYNKSDYWISYKAALVLYGIVENTNDIDLCCNKKMMDSLEKDGCVIEKASSGDIRKAIINDRIECFENNRRPTIKMNGYNVETVDSILKLYKDMNREKDQKTIETIERHQSLKESEVLDEQINNKIILDKAKDIMDKMNNIQYGSVYANGKISKRDSNDWYDDSNKFCPQPVLSTLKTKTGHCIDQSELERYYFKKANIKHKVFSMFPERGSNMYHNHAFLVFFDENDTPYWFDHAWYSERGIHKGDSLEELFKKICDKKRKADPKNDPENVERFKNIKYEIFEVPAKSCLCWDDYIDWVWKQKLVYKG